MVQLLGLQAFTAEGPGSIPGQGTEILHASWLGQKKKKKNYGGSLLCNGLPSCPFFSEVTMTLNLGGFYSHDVIFK